MTLFAAALALLTAGAGHDALLPAYAHNDYESQRPLFSALELGYRGAEVDVFLVEGELRVGHDPQDLVAGRTLQSLYLAPLETIRRAGSVLPDGTPFLLTVEAKEPGVETYAAIHEALSAFPELVWRLGPEGLRGSSGAAPVQVVLVGWHPPLAALARAPERFASVQLHAEDLATDRRVFPVHLVALISQDYPELFRWRGRGAMPPHERYLLAALVETAHAVPGRRLRVFNVPASPAVYRALLNAGVDLIGTKTPVRSRALLLEVRDAWPVSSWARRR